MRDEAISDASQTDTRELEALIAALPGQVFRSDIHATQLTLNPSLMKIVGLEEEAVTDRGWLSAVKPEDLVGGALLFQPWHRDSAVMTATLRAGGGTADEIRLRVLVAPIREGSGKRFVGTVFRNGSPENPIEYVAAALLERVAALGGFVAQRISSIAPLAPAQQGSKPLRPSPRPIALFIGFREESLQDLAVLLEAMGWSSVMCEDVSSDLAAAAKIIFVNGIDFIPADIPRCSLSSSVIGLVERSAEKRIAELTQIGCKVLTFPLDIIAAEEVLVEFRRPDHANESPFGPAV